jgi:hypothetical protein
VDRSCLTVAASCTHHIEDLRFVDSEALEHGKQLKHFGARRCSVGEANAQKWREVVGWRCITFPRPRDVRTVKNLCGAASAWGREPRGLTKRCRTEGAVEGDMTRALNSWLQTALRLQGHRNEAESVCTEKYPGSWRCLSSFAMRLNTVQKIR